jgi:hypothetical protein
MASIVRSDEFSPEKFRAHHNLSHHPVISMRCRSNLVLLVGILACAGVEDELASLKPTSQATCVGQSQLFQLTPAIGRIGASIRRARFTAQGVTTRVSEVDGYLTNTLPEVPVDRV